MAFGSGRRLRGAEETISGYTNGDPDRGQGTDVDSSVPPEAHVQSVTKFPPPFLHLL